MQTNEMPGGFTLVELLIAMMFIAILSAIALLSIEGPREEAYLSTMQADLKNLSVAQELHHQLNFEYGTLTDLADYEASRGVTVTINEATAVGYAATAMHAGLDGVVCGFYQGDVTPGTAGPADEAGQPICD